MLSKSKVKKIMISEELCKGCGLCIAMCPTKVLGRSKTLSSRGVYPPVVVNKEKCTGCRLCQYYCPDFAIYVVEEDED